MTDKEMMACITERVKVVANDYTYNGWLRIVFQKRKGLWRCVVEDANGRLFIHNSSQLRHGHV